MAAGLLVQAIWLVRLEQPSYMDAYYYSTNGIRLAGGHGFSEMIVWQFLDNPDGLPIPSHTYWMPLPSVLAAIGYLIRADFLGEQLVFWLLSGLLPILAFAISLFISGERWQAWVAALLTASGSFYGAFFSQPSTFTPFALFGGLCLLMLGLSSTSRVDSGVAAAEKIHLRKQRLLWLLAGVFAGFAHLTRADGALLIVAAGLIWIIQIRRRISLFDSSSESELVGGVYRKPIRDLILFIAGYLLIMGGWLLRNWIVIGRPLSTVSMQSIFLTTYDDLFSYGRSLNLENYLAWGLDNIILSKLESLWVAIQTLIVVPGVIFLVPFVVIALVHFYRRPAQRALLRPAVWYSLLLIITMSMIFTFPGMRGAIFHSSSALWPWSTALAAAGIGLSVDWVASRLPHWQPEKAKRRFSVLFILLAFAFGFYVSESRANPPEDPDLYHQIKDLLPPDAIVMSGNAPAVNYHMDLPAVSVPNEPVDVVVQSARRYGVTHLMLDEDTPDPLTDIYSGKVLDPRVELIQEFGAVKVYQLSGLP
jgi:hypothetical protein